MSILKVCILQKSWKNQQGAAGIAVSDWNWHSKVTVFHKSLIFIPFKSCMSWKAGNSIAMISGMSKSAFCSSKSTHWHHFCSWLLIQRESFQGVTGGREGDVYLTLVLSELSNAPRTSGDSLNHPGVKILLFKLFRALYTLLFLSVSANSARKENQLST